MCVCVSACLCVCVSVCLCLVARVCVRAKSGLKEQLRTGTSLLHIADNYMSHPTIFARAVQFKFILARVIPPLSSEF